MSTARPLAAVVAVALAGCAGTVRPDAADPRALGPVHFVEDDYALARADATARKALVFVEAWAPW